MIENFTQRKILFAMLSLIYYRVWKDSDGMSEMEFYRTYKVYIDKLRELGFVDDVDWTVLTKEGLFQMDNNYVVGRISFVLLVKRLMKTSKSRVVSLISRALNIILHPSMENDKGVNSIFEEIVSFITLSNLKRMKYYIDRRIAQMNTASIPEASVFSQIKSLHASAQEETLAGSPIVTRESFE